MSNFYLYSAVCIKATTIAAELALAKMAVVESEKCPAFFTQLFKCYECTIGVFTV